MVIAHSTTDFKLHPRIVTACYRPLPITKHVVFPLFYSGIVFAYVMYCKCATHALGRMAQSG